MAFTKILVFMRTSEFSEKDQDAQKWLCSIDVSNFDAYEYLRICFLALGGGCRLRSYFHLGQRIKFNGDI